ncbi:hypothetical protein CIHG_08822 [Coccidioides immitis H538.4]|uniref:Uncharacterized protein n=3 Tax=Coccidioides immitis TaxID=5501 RepID=A0A0J8TUQ3_COCIT|nr:hypothetical protein CIRG_04717 [Coccidioides immitis RMSCC 2394]KMU77562.1 hypothetical protein CISG_01320 [Coccidioides immitis RMSCC 3703]KMU90966.1 hypothetical protein CIHG_08822 [Coccidioides immitis H538.4]
MNGARGLGEIHPGNIEPEISQRSGSSSVRFRRTLDVQKEVEGLGIQALGGDPSIDMSKTSGYMLYPRVKRSFMGPNLKRDSISGLGEVKRVIEWNNCHEIGACQLLTPDVRILR